MPTPTSKAETRSERLIRLAIQAAEDLRLEIKPDEASGTPNQVELTCDAPDGVVTITTTWAEYGLRMHGVLAYSGKTTTRDLFKQVHDKVILEPSLFDAQSDSRVLTTIKGVLRNMKSEALPKNSKRSRIMFDDLPGPHDAPTQELAVA